MPCRNDRGRMPGSARFLSPEEYELGAPLDGLTLQYTMGALAFAFLADHGSREAGAWMAAAPLYAVAVVRLPLRLIRKPPLPLLYQLSG